MSFTPSPHTPPPQHSSLLWKSALLAVAVVGIGSLIVNHPYKSTTPSPQHHYQATELSPMALDIPMLPPSETSTLLRQSQFSQVQQNTIFAALKSNRLKLAQAFFADASGQTGHILEISCGGFTQQIILSPQGQTVPLPIDQEGIVQIRWVNASSPTPLRVATVNTLRQITVLPNLSSAHPAMAFPVLVQ